MIEDRWKLAPDGVTEGIWDCDITANKVFYSEKWKVLLGYSGSEIGDTLEEWSKRVHPNDLETTLNVVNNHLNGLSDSYATAYRIRCKEGDFKWVLDEGRVVSRDNQANPLRMIGTLKAIVPNKGLITYISLPDVKIEDESTEEKLKKSEEKYRKLVESVNDVIYEIDANGTIKFVSPSVIKVLGYTVEEVTGRNLFEFVYSEDVPGIMNSLKNLSDKEYNYLEYRYLRKDGSIHWVRSSTSSIFEDGVMVGGTGILTDITDRRIAQEKIEKLSRLYLVISHVNQAIIRIRDKVKLMHEVCRIAIEYGKFRMAWIGLIDEETQLVKPVVAWGFENGYLSVIPQISVSDVPEGQGPTGTAIREGKHYVCDNTESDPRLGPWREEALMRGYYSSISLPLKQFGKIFGAFSLYSSAAGFFNQEEIGLLDEIADEIGFAFESIETENERRVAEEQLRKLSQAVEQSPVSIIIADLHGNIEYVNSKACETTGYTPEELLGRNPRLFKSGETPTPEYHELWRKISSGKEWHGVFHNKRKNGELFWESSTISPIIDKNGISTHYLAVNEDITESKLAEESLILSEANLNYAQELAGMGSWDFNLITNKINWSRNNYRLFGIEPGQMEITNDFFLSRIHPEDLPLIEQNLQVMKRTRRSTIIDIRLITPDGKIKWIQNHIVPAYKDDMLIAFNGVNIDITEKIQKDEAIQKLSMAVEQSPVSIVITDLNANIEYVNPAFENITMYTSEEVIGRNIKILKSGKTDKTIYEKLWKTIKRGEEWNGEWMNKKKNGELFWEKISITPIHNENGKTSNYLAVKQDITLSKQAEQEISELNANLELKIAERTSELAATNLNLLKVIEERKRIEEALVQGEQSYRKVVENVSDVIFQTDANGRWLFLNKSWEDMSGFKVEESLGQLFINYVHPLDRQRNMELFEPLINRKKEYCRHEARYLTKDGGFRWIEVFARLGLNDRDEITGTYGTLQDITERRRAEEFENELLQLSPKLTGIPPSEIDSALNLALSRIAKFLEADRSYIFEFNAEQSTMSNTFEWCNEGICAEIHNLQDIPCEMLPAWMNSLMSHENIVIPSVTDLPESWQAEREILEPQGIQSLIVIPIITENNLIGFVGLDCVKRKKEYNVSEINNLKVWSSMIASLINDQRAERLLEQTRQNYETFFNTIDDFLFVIDQQGNIIHTNNTVNHRLEFSKEELFNQSILAVHPPDRREEANRIVGEMLAGISEYCPVPIVTKSGRQIPVETRVKPGFWNGKQVIFGVSKDISQIKLSEQKFSTAFHSNSAMMAISDFYNGEYIDVNNSLIEIMGYSRDELLGINNKELRLFVDSTLRGEIIQKLSQNIAVRKLELELRTKDGSIRTGLISCDSIFIGDKRCMLSVTMDITERKKAEEEIKKARMAADESNLAKSEFLSRMSHELRTPMNSILGFAQLLQMGELTQRQTTGVNHILSSGKHLLDLINEVLDISRIESGRISLSLEPVQLNGIFLETMDIIHPLASARKLKIELVKSPDNLIFVKSDRQRLKQVFLNLLNNAIKYNRDGGAITIKTELVRENYHEIETVRISITDTGIGISSGDIKKLFKPFERIGAEKTQTEGTGLGLAVVKKLMEAMGGIVGVESAVGEGSTFWIELPKSKSQLEGLENSNNMVSLESLPDTKQGTILYIEDNESNIELVEQILSSERSNIRLISNVNGKQAVSLAIEFTPDLILLDLNLPDIHGNEVLALLQSEQRTKSIPVVVISADAMPKQIEKLLKAGARNYLTKPLEISAFLVEVDRWIGK
jgi:PAS domain S-box-containing protein